MPTYKITDPTSGKMLRVTGDSPPTEKEIMQIFEAQGEKPAPKPTPQETTTPKTTGMQDFATGIKRGLASVVTGIGQRTGLIPQSDVDLIINEFNKERAGEGFSGKAGEFVGGMAPYALIPGGQATALTRVGVNAATGAGSGLLEPTTTSESPIKNALTGMALGVAIPGAIEGGAALTKPTGKWLYAKSLKTPISEKWKKALPGEEFSRREQAVETGFKNKIVPNRYGRAQVDKTINELHGQVESIVDDLTAQGGLDTNVYDLVKNGLKTAKSRAFVSSDSKTAQGAVRTIEDEVIKKGGVKSMLNPRQLQDVKEQFYREIDWDRTKNIVTPGGQFTETARKGIANQAMLTLESMHPEIASLNKKTGAYIALKQAIEHSIARYENLNVGGLQAIILAVKNIGLGALEIVSGTPTVKAKMAFAINEGAKRIRVKPAVVAGITQQATQNE